MKASLDNMQYKRTFFEQGLLYILCKFQIIKRTSRRVGEKHNPNSNTLQGPRCMKTQAMLLAWIYLQTCPHLFQLSLPPSSFCTENVYPLTRHRPSYSGQLQVLFGLLVNHCFIALTGHHILYKQFSGDQSWSCLMLIVIFSLSTVRTQNN